MPAEVIDLVSSPITLPQPVASRLPRKSSSKPPVSLSRTTSAPVQDEWLNISSDIEVPLPPLPPANPATIHNELNVTSTAHNVDWLAPLSSDSLPSPGASWLPSKPGKSTSTAKSINEVLFLSDDFDSTINLDESVNAEGPSAKKRRISLSPKARSSKPAVVKSRGYKRSLSNVESSTKTGAKWSVSGSLKRTATTSRALELDPLIFTSSPDPFADSLRKRKEKSKQPAREYQSDESDIFDLDSIKPGAGDRGKLIPTNGNGLSDHNLLNLSSDADFPDIDTLPSGPPVKRQAKSSNTVLAEYNAQRAKEKKLLEKAQRSKGAGEEKLAQKENKRVAKEVKAKDKEKAAEMAKVNTLRTDKKISTPEMIVDLPSTLEKKVLEQTRTFLDGLQVEHTTWDSTSPIIKWRRKVVAVYNEDLGHYEPVAPHVKKEKHVMYIMTALEFVKLATGEEGNDLDTHVLRLKSKFDTSEIIFLIQGYNSWMRKNKNIKNRQYTQAVRSQMPEEEQSGATQRRKKKEAEYVDGDEVEDAMLRLQVAHGALIHHTSVVNETAEWIAVFTQQISTIPYRSQKQSLDTAFCMESGQVKTGDGVSDTYTKMLQEVSRLTAPVAYGIAAEYPTLRKLVDGLERNGPLALEECRKSANKDGAFTDRRVGPAISKRVYKVFTGRDSSSLDV